MPRARGLIFPLALIVIGVLVLLANVGILSAQALERLVDLWPLLLVIIGLQLVLNHTLPRTQATIIGLAATAVIVLGALAYAVLAPSTAFGSQHAESSQQLGGLSAATLNVNYGASSVDIRSGGIGDNLYRAAVDYPAGENPPTFTIDQQTGSISIEDNARFGGFHFFGSRQRQLTVTLSDRIPWTIRLGGGASSLKLQLPELQLNNLDVSGGASTVEGSLGKPKGSVGVHISGGASNLKLRIPAGSQWKVDVSGGVSSVTVNGESSGGLGNFTKQSSGYDGATDRFDVTVSGGVSHLDLQAG